MGFKPTHYQPYDLGLIQDLSLGFFTFKMTSKIK